MSPQRTPMVEYIRWSSKSGCSPEPTSCGVTLTILKEWRGVCVCVFFSFQVEFIVECGVGWRVGVGWRLRLGLGFYRTPPNKPKIRLPGPVVSSFGLASPRGGEPRAGRGFRGRRGSSGRGRRGAGRSGAAARAGAPRAGARAGKPRAGRAGLARWGWSKTGGQFRSWREFGAPFSWLKNHIYFWLKWVGPPFLEGLKGEPKGKES